MGKRFKNAAGALATRNESEARLAWPERSGGNLDSREDEERRCGGFIGFSELGAGCSKDGLGQDVPATVKKRARCPRSRIESRFMSDLGLSTFGPSALHFQNFSVSAFPLLPPAFTPWGGTNVGTGRKFPKKVSVHAYTAFECALKTRRFLILKPFRLFRSGAKAPSRGCVSTPWLFSEALEVRVMRLPARWVGFRPKVPDESIARGIARAGRCHW